LQRRTSCFAALKRGTRIGSELANGTSPGFFLPK